MEYFFKISSYLFSEEIMENVSLSADNLVP